MFPILILSVEILSGQHIPRPQGVEEGEIIGVNWDASTPLRVPEYQYKGANMAVKFLG